MIESKYDGKMPDSIEELVKCQGLPKNRGSNSGLRHNQSSDFIETNIRSVFIHHFFEDRDDVSDKEIFL
jgi:A/G-specific adenine glycosylase